MFGPLAYPQARELPFQFVKQNIDKLLELLPREVGTDDASFFPFCRWSILRCDPSERVAKFFQNRIKAYTGGPRNLEQVLEGIDLCIAERAKLGPELAAFLKQY